MEMRSEPLVRASVTMNVPVFKCTNPNCRGGLYGAEADEIMDPIKKFLSDRVSFKD
jgi:hypothetical protein